MSFNPNWVVPPGNTISDVLTERDMSKERFSQCLEEDMETVESLLLGNYRISPDLATKLKKVLGFTEKFWLDRDQIYCDRAKALEEEWVKRLPISEMRKRGLIRAGESLIQSCFEFFGIRSLSEWNLKYKSQINTLAFRKSESFQTDGYSIAVWVRQAEILTNKYPVGDWNGDLFEQKIENEIKPLTRVKDPTDFLPKLIRICAQCGIKLAIVPQIGKSRASGATKFVDKKALMILSFRYLTDDHFWFTFFHEAGHLILHSESILRVETDDRIHNDEETEANLFAEACLIPESLKNELYTLNSNKKKLVSFAMKAGISPGIVVGQLQFKGVIKHSYLNSYKRRYRIEDIQSGIKLAFE